MNAVQTLIKKVVLICYLAMTLVFAGAQTEGGNKEQIIVENADQAVVETDKDPQITRYLGNVRAYHNGAFIFCDNAILTGNNLYAVGNVSIIEHDTIQIYSDTLLYQGDSSVAYLIKEVVLVNGKDTIYAPELRYNLNTKVSDYSRRALMRNATNELKSQYGFYNTATKDAGFFEKVSIVGDSLNLITDTLYYNTETTQSYWTAPTLIEEKGNRMFSNSGRYNLDEEYGYFVGNAQYESDTATAIADTIYYSGATNLIELKGKANYRSLTDTANAEYIKYNRADELIELEGNASYTGDGNRAKGEKLIYNKKTESFKFTGRSELEDGSIFIKAENLDYQKDTREGLAIGQVEYRDTAEKISIWADTLAYNGESNFMRATSAVGKPVMATEVDDDTLFISARVLRTFQEVIYGRKKNNVMEDSTTRVFPDSTSAAELEPRLIDSISQDSLVSMPDTAKSDIPITAVPDTISPSNIGLDTVSLDGLIIHSDSSLVEEPSVPIFIDSSLVDTVQYLIAEEDVVLYKSDMQARCDSLYFNDFDSTFVLLYLPVMWSDTSQITGDTIRIKLVDEKVDQLIVNDNAFMTNSPDFKFFNQVKGKIFVADFEESEMKTMKVNGNAQIVYYMLDDEDGYIGANTTDCSFMTFYFQEKKISDIRFYNSPQSKILPMVGTDHESIKLKGFNLRFEERPLSKEDLFDPEKMKKVITVNPAVDESSEEGDVPEQD